MKAISTQIVDIRRERAIRLWRDGRLNEARPILQDLLSNRAALTPEQELTFKKDLGMLECDAGRVEEALSIMLDAAPLADLTSDVGLRGRFYNELGSVFWQLRRFDDAFEQFTASIVSHEQAGDWKACAETRNNLAVVLIDAGQPSDAHKYLDQAGRVFETLGEYASIAQVWDTRARAYFKQGAVDEALEVALKSVEYLRTADEPRLLSESLATLSLVCEAKRIADALIQAEGCITDAAYALGIKHNTSLQHLLETKFPQLLHLRKPKTHSRRKR
jgi:tetratricopeptide (TPR) repeat protein